MELFQQSLQAPLFLPQGSNGGIPRFFVHWAQNRLPQWFAGIENRASSIAKADESTRKISPCERARDSPIIPGLPTATNPQIPAVIATTQPIKLGSSNQFDDLRKSPVA